jgi:hypothetical protein
MLEALQNLKNLRSSARFRGLKRLSADPKSSPFLIHQGATAAA